MSGRDEVTDAAPHVLSGVERMVRLVLLAGIAVSVVLMAFGLGLLAVRGDEIPTAVTPVVELARDLLALRASAYLSLGLIVLIATPFVRVGGSIIAFAREGDRRYVAVTALVLVVMCLSVLVGKA